VPPSTACSPSSSEWLDDAARELIRRALEEDLGAGDLTSAACVPPETIARGRWIAKQALVVAGIELLRGFYEAPCALVLRCASGDRLPEGALLATVSGPARLLLACERVALNFLQRLSGVATLTRQFADRLAGTGVQLLDTRKTTPGLRRLEKLAVRAGGGGNHRIGLYDRVLIKENHVTAAGGVAQALEATRPLNVPVEIEVRDLNELRQALDARATAVLLDNFTPELVREAVTLAGKRATVEVSGGVTLDNVQVFAEARPDFISVGALTHSAPAADISFLLDGVVPHAD
jgi:nicotinate-nucleotide pyrophosphorylase (carboxylating)